MNAKGLSVGRSLEGYRDGSSGHRQSGAAPSCHPGTRRCIFLPMSIQKIFCYVDETGLDPASRLFIVSVVIAAASRDALLADLATTERVSGKGRHKWTHTRPAARAAYIARVVHHRGLQDAIYYATYPTAGNYPVRTVLTVARAITLAAPTGAKATVFVDGLRKSQYHWFGTELRHSRSPRRKSVGCIPTRRMPSCGWPTPSVGLSAPP